jgi:hypothetical protein
MCGEKDTKQASNKQQLTENKDRIINFEILPANRLTKKFILNPDQLLQVIKIHKMK